MELKEPMKSRLIQHPVGISTHRKVSSFLYQMVIIQDKQLLALWHPTYIHHGLTIVFTGRFQPLNLEQTVGGGIELYMPDALLNDWVVYGNRTILHQSRIGKTDSGCQS